MPRLAQRDVDPVRPPRSEQRDQAAAADVDQVLREQMRARIADASLAPEQRDVRGLAPGRANAR